MFTHKKFIGVVIAMIALFVLPTVAMGHAHLKTGSPAPNETVTETLSTVQLQFTEAVHVNDSIFRVYRIDERSDADPDEKRIDEFMREALQAAARRQSYDEANRADTDYTSPSNISERVDLTVKDDILPGTYVVMWRVRSVDTHITDEYYVFHYEPK